MTFGSMFMPRGGASGQKSRILQKCDFYNMKSGTNLAVPRQLFCFGSLVILVVVCRYLLLFLLYINTEIGKNRCNLLD